MSERPPFLCVCCELFINFARTKAPIDSPWVSNDALSKTEHSRSGRSRSGRFCFLFCFLWLSSRKIAFSVRIPTGELSRSFVTSNWNNHVLHSVLLIDTIFKTFSRRIVAKCHTIILQLVRVWSMNCGRSWRFFRFFFLFRFQFTGKEKEKKTEKLSSPSTF